MKKSKIAIILAAIVAIGALLYFTDKYVSTCLTPEVFRDTIASYGIMSYLIFAMLMMAQVIAFFLPSDAFLIGGGYAFGFLPGLILSFIGSALGSAVTFLIARRFGIGLVKRLVGTEKYLNYSSMLQQDRSKAIIFSIYLIPGIPKDIIGYVLGTTSMGFRDFFIVTNLAKLPHLAVFTAIGCNIYSRNYTNIFMILSAVAGLIIISMVKPDLPHAIAGRIKGMMRK